MNASDIVKSNTEKTTMDAFNNACNGIRNEVIGGAEFKRRLEYKKTNKCEGNFITRSAIT